MKIALLEIIMKKFIMKKNPSWNVFLIKSDVMLIHSDGEVRQQEPESAALKASSLVI